jgi:hypothetical protein
MFLSLAFLELIRYEIVLRLRGFKGVHAGVRNARTGRSSAGPEVLSRICAAVALAACFYWKPILCMQRAAVTTRLLRRYGIPASLVIGYRPSPFFSHAWVEVDGNVVNDSPVFQTRLFVLDRL